ncbi:MAG TPA: Flp pilus assembly protein CpaB [Thauera sp.]|nr:Flp pilus assembly protein CpaB [Thauera sp.]HRA80785.1 Flp pilus assembly protein CpaB [Thauera sp.]
MALRLSRNTVILSTAAVFGLAAAWLASRYLDDRIADIEQRQQHTMARAVVPKSDLPTGTALTHDAVAVREVPVEWLHSAAITPDQFERAAGATLAHPARGGEPLLWSQLEGRQVSRFSARLGSGRRAATIPVDELSSQSGMLAPGDLVDLLVTVQNEKHNLTFPLLQSVSVIATGAHSQPGQVDERGRSFGAITLDLDPQQAAQVVAARTIGKLTALLRSPGDHARDPVQRTDALVLLGLGESEAHTRRGVPVIYGGGNALRLDFSPLELNGVAALTAPQPFPLHSGVALGAPATPLQR